MGSSRIDPTFFLVTIVLDSYLNILFFRDILLDYEKKVFGNIIFMKSHLKYVMKIYIMDTIKG